MNDTHSPLSYSATTSRQITQLVNIDVLILTLTSVDHELNDEFLMIDDEC